MYKIKISYQTGNSFGSEDTEVTLDYGWEDVNVVTQNLKRIKEHYELYKEMADEYHATFEEMKSKYGKKDWFVEDSRYTAELDFVASHSLYLYLDDGSKFQYGCSWCGYFESLYSGEILGPSFEV